MVEQLRANHQVTPPLTKCAIEEIEEALSYQLPTDVEEFYRLCNGAELFEERGRPGHLTCLVSMADGRRLTKTCLSIPTSLPSLLQKPRIPHSIVVTCRPLNPKTQNPSEPRA